MNWKMSGKWAHFPLHTYTMCVCVCDPMAKAVNAQQRRPRNKFKPSPHTHTHTGSTPRSPAPTGKTWNCAQFFIRCAFIFVCCFSIAIFSGSRRLWVTRLGLGWPAGGRLVSNAAKNWLYYITNVPPLRLSRSATQNLIGLAPNAAKEKEEK